MDLDEYGLNKVIDVAVITNESGELPVDLVDVRTIERFKGTWGPFFNPLYEFIASHRVSLKTLPQPIRLEMLNELSLFLHIFAQKMIQGPLNRLRNNSNKTMSYELVSRSAQRGEQLKCLVLVSDVVYAPTGTQLGRVATQPI